MIKNVLKFIADYPSYVFNNGGRHWQGAMFTEYELAFVNLALERILLSLQTQCGLQA